MHAVEDIRVAVDAHESAAASASLKDARVPLPGQRSSSEVRVLIDQLRLMAEAYAPYPDIMVKASHGGGWYCGLGSDAEVQAEKYVRGEIPSLGKLPDELFRPKEIHVDLDDIASWPEQRLIGVQSHEIGHAKHTDYKLLLEGQAQALKQGNLPSSWAGMSNALEDPWINNREMSSSDPRRAALEELYAHWIERHQSGVENDSLLNQLGLNAIHYWSTGKNVPTLTDERVLGAWERIRESAEKYFNGKSARENFELMQREIWPIARELEEKSVEDRMLNDLAKRLGGKSAGSNGSGRQQSASGSGPKQGGPSAGEEGARTGQSSTRAGGGEAGAGDSNGKSSATGTGDRPKNIWERVKHAIFGDPAEQNEKKLNQAAEKARAQAGVPNPPASLSEPLSPANRDALKKVIDNLDPGVRKQLEERAREALDRAQIDFQKETFRSPLALEKDGQSAQDRAGDDEPQSLEEAIQDLEQELAEAHRREDADAQAERAVEAARLAKEHRDHEMRREGFTPDIPIEEQFFDNYKELERSVAGYIGPFVSSLRTLLPKERELFFQGAFYSGSKLDFQEIARRVPVKDFKIHKRPAVQESPRAKMFVTLLIDNTQSMEGDKMHQTRRTAVFWCRVLDIFEIPFAMKLFGSSVITLKTFDQDFDDPASRVKHALMAKADASMSSTDIGSGLLEAKEEMQAKRRQFKDSVGAIFVLSDSGANSGLTGLELAHEAGSIAQRFALTNFILTRNQSEIAQAITIFGEKNVVAPEDFSKLCPESIRVLRGTLNNFRRKLKL